jgi:lipopolysaccharide biosynthesis regulator YciM
MSMLHLLRKWIDIIEYRKVEDEKRRKAEVRPTAADDDEFVGVMVEPPGDGPAPKMTCRVCGYQAETRHPYCPRCLAETMVKRR